MKKILLLLAAVGMIFTACEAGGEFDDDNGGNNTEQPGGGNQGGEDNPDNPGGGDQGGEDNPDNPGGGDQGGEDNPDNPGGGDQGGDQGGEDIPADKTQAIKFQDENTKLLCTLHWDENEDGELSYEEAAAVTDLGTAFNGSSILAFNELKFFTGLESISSNAFSDCVSLVKITLPEQITSIGSYVFYGCINLKKINIPDGITKIGRQAFYACTGELIINSKIVETDYTGSNYPMDKNYYGTGGWLNGSRFTKLTIGNNITKIGDYVFYGCSNLASVTIPDSVTSIGDFAFCDCSGLTAFYGKLASADSRCLIINGTLSAFAQAGLTTYTIPDSVTSIGDYAFYYCYSLTSVTIPDSVTSIGAQAFYDCTGELIINSKIVETDYTESNYPMCSNGFGNLGWLCGSKFTKLTIGDNITKIGDYMFGDCSTLTNIVIPSQVVSIGKCAFNSCTSLTEVIIPNSVTTIGELAFVNCQSLTGFYGKFASADNRCLIEDGVLHGFAPAGLTTYTIPDSVTSIGDCAFYGCSSLASVTIPNSVASIGDSAFSGCSNLTEISIPNGVVSIGSGTFNNCSSLTNITIPDSVTSIGSYAFLNCTRLGRVYCKPTTPPSMGDNLAFVYYSDYFDKYYYIGCKIYVPRNSVSAYKAAQHWRDYASDIAGYDF